MSEGDLPDRGGAEGDWSLAAVHDVLAAAVPDREMLICGPVRRTFGEVHDRTCSVAAFLAGRGFGARSERDRLERWESGQDAVALVLHNCAEYVEAMLGAYRARAVPFNVNQHYAPGEIGDLLAALDTRAVVYHRGLGPLVAAACDAEGLTLGDLVLVDVDDGSGVDPLPGSAGFEDVAATPVDRPLPDPSPDDLYMVCTGGTTGRPKAVLWRQADIYCSGMAGVEGATAASIAGEASAEPAGPWFTVAPLMHAAAQWTVYSALHRGTPVLLDQATGPFDPSAALALAEREGAGLVQIVGDAHARPLVDELQRRTYELGSVQIIATGGAATGEHLKEALLDHLPDAMIIDGYGASETGGMAFGASTRGARAEGFGPSTGAVVLSEDRSRVLAPGDGEIGWTARQGRVPLGYLGHPERTRETFPVVDGRRMSVPGDRAQLLADGSIRMLGRDAMVVNSGGEKIFVEEVEAVLRTHPDVVDALVVGRPSERFGQEVVAVVAGRDGAALDPAALREHVAADVARFKAPRAVVVCDEVRRLASGKADYRWAREMAATAVAATAAS